MDGGTPLSRLNVDLAFGVDFGRYDNKNVLCPFHEAERGSRSLSCSVSAAGTFHCHACGAKGNAYEFYAKVKGITVAEARRQLCDPTIAPTPVKKVTRYNTAVAVALANSLADVCHKDLLKHDKRLSYLHNDRGLTFNTIRQFNIGCDEWRITIPIYNEEHKLVNIRRYLPRAQTTPKMLSHERGDGSPVLYPIGVLESMKPNDELIVCEGEWDCLLLNQHGFKAVTNTGNCKTWRPEWTERIVQFNLVIIYDVNDKEDDLGQRMAQERCKEFFDAGANVKVVKLPLTKEGGDITDWFVEERKTADELRQLIDSTNWYTEEVEETPSVEVKPVDTTTNVFLTLHEAADASQYFKRIRMRCLVAGKGTAPYIVPSHVMVEITDEDGSKSELEHKFDCWDGRLLQLIECSDISQKLVMKSVLGIARTAAIEVTILDSLNIEEVYLIPSIDQERDHGPYAMRRAFYVGHGLQTNRVYDFEGFTLAHPKNQSATHILVTATPSVTDVESFNLDEERYERLRHTFQTNDVYNKANDIADALSSHITHIYGRADLHIAVDLVFHSPLSFTFDDHYMHKGWLEGLVLGDTRTGKGYVTEGLVRHYGAGDVVSGENLTQAGLIGGIQKIGERFCLIWGKVPLSDRGLVVLDECGGLSHTDIGRLSRIRSEGVAEVTKIISEKTSARTRLIWLGNPRPYAAGSQPRILSDYNYGIEAVTELVGAAEDVARFDFVLIVAKNEVPSDTINKAHPETGTLVYTKELCRDLLMWCWSRKPEQIVFENDVVDFCYRAARDLGKKFSPKICLVQAEDVRFKLARIAAAIAGRTFSTSDGVHLIVTRQHMQFAYNFLHHIYSKPCCGYLQMSEQDRERSTLREPDAVRAVLDNAENVVDLIDGLMEHRLITARDLCDYANVDIYQARGLISDLVRLRALVKDNNGYVKKPAFKHFLIKLKASLAVEPPTTTIEENEAYVD